MSGSLTAMNTALGTAICSSKAPLSNKIIMIIEKRLRADYVFNSNKKNRNSLNEVQIEEYEAKLKNLENELYNAFPYNKYGDGRDTYTYNRVRPKLDQIHVNYNLIV
jgi:hypothetical protein